MNPKDYLYYSQQAEVVDVRYGLANGGKLSLRLEYPDDYHAFAAITKRSGNRAGQILLVRYRHPGDEEFKSVECWFAGWTVGHKSGCVLGLTLDDDGFDQLRVLDKGAELEVLIYQIEDDGQVHNETRRASVEAALKGGVYSKQAGKACHDLSFHRFLETEGLSERVEDPAQAATIVRSHCRIKSRAELDHNEQALARWQALYRRWLATYL